MESGGLLGTCFPSQRLPESTTLCLSLPFKSSSLLTSFWPPLPCGKSGKTRLTPLLLQKFRKPPPPSKPRGIPFFPSLLPCNPLHSAFFRFRRRAPCWRSRPLLAFHPYDFECDPDLDPKADSLFRGLDGLFFLKQFLLNFDFFFPLFCVCGELPWSLCAFLEVPPSIWFNRNPSITLIVLFYSIFPFPRSNQ